MKIVKEKIEISELAKFLVKAKKNTYASNGEGGERKLENGGRELIYEDSGYKYIDTYFGFSPFIGQEIVSKNGEVIWVMNYWGLIYKDIVSPKEIYTFLKKALMQPDPLVPLRGPEKFEEGEFQYSNIGGGAIETYFQHVETIFYRGERVFELQCHGGVPKN